MLFYRLIDYITLVLVLSCLFFVSTFAAGTIPRDGLRLELLLATGSKDTSGNARIVSSTGSIPTHQIDPTYGVAYAQFSGNGGFKANTAWSTSGTDDFTVSMWIKIDQSVFDTQYAGYFGVSGAVCFLSTGCKSYTPVRFPTTIFTTKNGELDDSSLHLSINNNGKCAIRSSKEYEHGGPYLISSYGDIRYESYHFNNGNAFVRSGMFTSMQDMFDCGVLKDSRWHHIVLRKQSSKIEMIIDEKSVGKINSNITLSRIISIGNLASFPMDQTIYGHLAQNIQNKIFSNHYLRGGIAKIRIYSKAINDNELVSLNDELRFAQGDLTGASGIQVAMDKYNKPILSFYLKGIPLNLAKERVTYQYSVATGSFFNINPVSINPISSVTGSLAYQVNLDISAIPDGKINIILRVKNSDIYQNVGTIGFVKNDTIYGININQPDMTNTVSKSISASTNSGGVLYLSITRGSICDSTITVWDDYTDLIFTSKSDNATRVCYKAVFSGTNKIIYRISDPIQGIAPANQFTTTTNLFADYAFWVKSAYPKPNDSASMVLELLSTVQRTNSYTTSEVLQGYSISAGNNVTMTDINGDGLVDFLYSLPNPGRRAIIVNNGNYTFKVTYKCVIDMANSVNTYYGDCADTTR